MSSLGTMQEGGSGVIALIYAKTQELATKVAIYSLESNSMAMTELQIATEFQAEAEKQSTLKQAESYRTEGATQITSGTLGIGAQVGSFGYGTYLQSSRAMQEANASYNTSENYESMITSGLRGEALPGVGGAEEVAIAPLGEGAAQEELNAARNLLNELRSEPNYTNGERFEEKRVEYHDAISKLRNSNEDRETIFDVLKAVKNAKKEASDARSNIMQKQATAAQTTNIIIQSLQSAVMGAGAFIKASIETAKAVVDKIKALMSFVTTLFNQMLQLDLGMFNQNISRSEKLVEGANAIAQMNRAV